MRNAESNAKRHRVWRAYRGEFTLLMVLHLSACGTPKCQIPENDNWYRKLAQRISAVERFAGEFECGEDLRQLLTDARSECPANGVAPPAEQSTESGQDGVVTAAQSKPVAGEEENSCGTEQLKGAFKRAERNLNPLAVDRVVGKRKLPRVNPLAFMLSHFSCGVLYLDADSNQPAEHRMEQLQALVKLPELPQTRYTILASTSRGEVEAQHRIEVMRQQLEALDVPADRIDRPWLYPFELQPTQISRAKLWPQPPAEPSELSRAVWVCRTNC